VLRSPVSAFRWGGNGHRSGLRPPLARSPTSRRMTLLKGVPDPGPDPQPAPASRSKRFLPLALGRFLSRGRGPIAATRSRSAIQWARLPPASRHRGAPQWISAIPAPAFEQLAGDCGLQEVEARLTTVRRLMRGFRAGWRIAPFRRGCARREATRISCASRFG